MDQRYEVHRYERVEGGVQFPEKIRGSLPGASQNFKLFGIYNYINAQTLSQVCKRNYDNILYGIACGTLTVRLTNI